MKNKRALGALYLLVALALVAVLLWFVVPNVSVKVIHDGAPNCDGKTALEIASNIGRLDLISIALTFLGIGVGFFAIFSFFAIREDARQAAHNVAEKVSATEVKKFFDLEKKNFIDSVVKEMSERTKSSVEGLPSTSGAEEQKP